MKSGVKKRLPNAKNVDEESKNKQSAKIVTARITFDEFVKACEVGNLADVQRGLIYLDPTALFNGALLVGIFSKQLKVVKCLLAEDSVKASVANHGNGALRCAAENGFLDAVNCLLEIDSVKAAAAFNDNEALRLAVTHKHHAIVDRLLEVPEIWQYILDNQLELITSQPEYASVNVKYLEHITHESLINLKYAIDLTFDQEVDDLIVFNSKTLTFGTQKADTVETIHESKVVNSASKMQKKGP